MTVVNGNGEGTENPAELMLKCIQDGRIDVLRSILSQLASKPDFHENVDGICCPEGSLLHFAVSLDSVDSVRTLLSSGVNPCVQNDANRTAYQMAKTDQIRAAFIQELLQSAAQSHLGRVCQMISAGIPVDSIDSPKTGNTALHWAAQFGSEDIVRTLCDSGASVNATNTRGEIPLHEAVRRGDEAIVRRLMQNGAEPGRQNAAGKDCYQLASDKAPHLIHILSLNTIQRTVRRSTSMESLDFDRASIVSTETAAIFSDRTASFPLAQLESWTDLLWPQPQHMHLDSRNRTVGYPKDGRLKIYFDGASEGEPRRIMQALHVYTQLLQGIGLELEYRGHKIPEQSSLMEGRMTCGIFDHGETRGAYTLTIDETGIALFAADYSGIRNGFATLVQILRINHNKKGNNNTVEGYHMQNGFSSGDRANGSFSSVTSTETATSGIMNGDASFGTIDGRSEFGRIPCLTIRDAPDMPVRAVYLDFSGCKILNTETVIRLHFDWNRKFKLLQLANRLGYCKANYLFVNFEVRTTDRYQLPYTNRDLFHLTQVCDELFVKLVPSLDLNSSYIEHLQARRIIDQFLDDFPLSRVAHFGPNLASILLTNRPMLDAMQKRVQKIYLSVDVDERNAQTLNNLPPFVTLCIDGRFPFEAETLLSLAANVVLKFSTSDTGFLCPAPDSTAKKALLAAKLGEKMPIHGTMMCDLSTGCEIMPPSLAYAPEIAALGVSWNRKVDVKRFCFLLPRIAAEHVLLDGNMASLFHQAATLGRVEHELTKISAGLKGYAEPLSPYGDPQQQQRKKAPPISVFLEMILNPDNMALERLTPIIFKKARIELRRSLKALDEARKTLPYNFELALVLAEIQLVTELLVLTSRLGQSLCMHGTNPSSPSADAQHQPLLGLRLINVGVANLPQTIRTDLANSLLEIRTKFQHTWLSRNIASTLPNALKMFDNLFRALLPPSLQDFGKNLL